MNFIINCTCIVSYIKAVDLCNFGEQKCNSIIWGGDFETALWPKLVEYGSIWSLVSSLIKQSLRTSLHSELACSELQLCTQNSKHQPSGSRIIYTLGNVDRVSHPDLSLHKVLHCKSDITQNNGVPHCKSSGKKPVDETRFQSLALKLI